MPQSLSTFQGNNNKTTTQIKINVIKYLISFTMVNSSHIFVKIALVCDLLMKQQWYSQ